MGEGKEGFIFSDEKHRYKVFRNRENILTDSQVDFLLGALSEGNTKLKRILPITGIITTGETYIIISPKIVGDRYAGGHWWDIVELLRECKEVGIALTNVHPANFIVTVFGLVFIDIGNSVKPLSDSLLTQMVRRAYLSFKFPDRGDLKELMTRSITEDIPELKGIGLLYHDFEGRTFSKHSLHSGYGYKPRLNVSLLIRTCYMEWATIEYQVEHLVTSLEKKYRFSEKIVICGSNNGPFLRQYREPDRNAEIKALERLKERFLIDRYLIAPERHDIVGEISRRWFNIEVTDPLSKNGEPTIDTLFGFEQCYSDLVLQTDSDIIVGGTNLLEALDHLIKVLNENQDAIGVSLPPPLDESQEYTSSGSLGKWRTEVRFSLINRKKIGQLLPLPNSLSNDKLELSWYRSLDLRLANSPFAFYRGGDKGAFMIHTPNEWKKNPETLFNVIKAIERGRVIKRQIGSVNLVGTLGEWIGKRKEKLVFIVRGRDTPLWKLHRCIESLKSQRDQSFGILFIDAGSTNGSVEILERLCGGEWRDRATLLRNRFSRIIIENIVVGIREVIEKRDAIVAMLDADDALIGEDVVTRVLDIYGNGADLTVGSMLRTDKYREYPVQFNNARFKRGSNVWQHLRTFRKYLFDNITEEDLKVDGDWIPYAEDWAFMLPMVEMANSPVWIEEPLYLYDPDTALHNYSIEEREEMIQRICQKKPYNKLTIHT